MKKFICCLVAALLTSAFAEIRPLNREFQGNPVIVPTVQKYSAADGVFQIPDKLTISVPPEEAVIIEQLNSELELNFGKKAVAAKDGAVQFILSDKAKLPEDKYNQGYRLEITPESIRIFSASTAGLFYGAQTLRSLISGADRPELRCAVIVDWPDFDRRGYFFSIRSMTRLLGLKKVLDAMAGLKMNWIMLEVAEKFPFKDNKLTLRQSAFTREELLDLADFCRKRHIEITPVLQVLSHSLWMTYHPNWKNMEECPVKWPWYSAVCPQNAEGRELTRQALEEHIEIFQPRSFLIMMDEIGIGKTWAKCPKCKGHKHPGYLAGEYLQFARNILKKHNVAAIICHDAFTPNSFAWKYGKEFYQYLEKDDQIVFWSYRERYDEKLLAKFKHNKLIGHSLNGYPQNTYTMADFIKKLGGDDCSMVYWYFSGSRGTFVNPLRETPEGYGGFTNGADYFWRRSPYIMGEVAYDGVYEFFRRIYPEKTVVVPRNAKYTPLSIVPALNCNLSRFGNLPQLNDEMTAQLKKVCAELPEKYDIVTEPGGKYFGIRLNAVKSKSKKIPSSAVIPCDGLMAKGLSFLLATTEAINSNDYFYAQKYGKNKLKHPAVAVLEFQYKDGAKYKFPLRFRWDVSEWNRPYGGVNMRHCVRGVDLQKRYFSFGTVNFVNPYPDKELAGIKFRSGFVDNISTVLLAVSAWDASGAPVVKKTVKPQDNFPPTDEIDYKLNIRADFEHGMGDVTVTSSKALQDKIKVEIIAEEIKPGVPNHVLKITVPPNSAVGDPESDMTLRVDVCLPYKCTADVKSLASNIRIETRDMLSLLRVHDYLVSNSKNTYWYYRMNMNTQWDMQIYKFGLRSVSTRLMRDITESDHRKISFFFNPSKEYMTFYIDDIGDSNQTLTRSGAWKAAGKGK